MTGLFSRISFCRTALAICAAGLLLGGCELSFEPREPGGTYVATDFDTTVGSVTTDQLAIGSTITITLQSNGTTTGHMHMAAQGGEPALDFDLTGTWSKVNDRVIFSHAADTFLRESDFNIDSSGLWTVTVFDGVGILLTLGRT